MHMFFLDELQPPTRVGALLASVICKDGRSLSIGYNTSRASQFLAPILGRFGGLLF